MAFYVFAGTIWRAGIVDRGAIIAHIVWLRRGRLLLSFLARKNRCVLTFLRRSLDGLRFALLHGHVTPSRSAPLKCVWYLSGTIGLSQPLVARSYQRYSGQSLFQPVTAICYSKVAMAAPPPAAPFSHRSKASQRQQAEAWQASRQKIIDYCGGRPNSARLAMIWSRQTWPSFAI